MRFDSVGRTFEVSDWRRLRDETNHFASTMSAPPNHRGTFEHFPRPEPRKRRATFTNQREGAREFSKSARCPLRCCGVNAASGRSGKTRPTPLTVHLIFTFPPRPASGKTGMQPEEESDYGPHHRHSRPRRRWQPASAHAAGVWGGKVAAARRKSCRKAGQRRWQAVGQMESFGDGPVVVPTALLSPGPLLPRREERESAQRQRAVPVSARSEHFPAQFA